MKERRGGPSILRPMEISLGNKPKSVVLVASKSSLAKILFYITGLLVLFGCTGDLSAQIPTKAVSTNQTVKVVRLKIDNQEVKEKFRVLLYANGETIEPRPLAEGFVVPQMLRNLEEIGVRVQFGEYDLVFGEVYHGKFEGDWTVGVDTAPVNSEYVTKRQAKQLKMLYYIEFIPTKKEATAIIIKVPNTNHKGGVKNAFLATISRPWRLFR